MWGCFLMSGVKILHFLKDWEKSIPIHQNYTMALNNSFFFPGFGIDDARQYTILFAMQPNASHVLYTPLRNPHGSE